MKNWMKAIQKRNSLKKLMVLILVSCITLFLGALILVPQKLEKSAKVLEYYEKYSRLKKPITKSVLENILEITRKVGVDGALELVALIETKNELNRTDCHAIMHLLGHQAYSSKLKTIPDLLKRYGHLCQSGFPHGIEAQISLEETDVKLRNKKLKDFCVLYKSFNPKFSSCYHGVGHAYYQQLRNPKKALNACDTLYGPNVDLKPCYQGVFSEFANDIRGLDGETGLPVPGQHKTIENQDRPLLYCSRFDEKYRDTCWFTMTVIAIKQRANNKDYSPCMDREYPDEAKNLCVEYLAAVTSRGELDGSDAFVVPREVTEMEPSLQRAYVKGLFGAVNAYARDGRAKNWKTICNSMSGELAGYCLDYGTKSALEYQNLKFIQ